jgi:TetR/AcrR family transcriptional regulator, lmrAB and yxaGH operons repressor
MVKSTSVNRQPETMIAVAMQLFQRQGYNGTGLTQLLTESGAPKGSFYHYFPLGKEQLAATAVAEASRQVGRMAAAAIADSTNCATALVLFAQRLAVWFESSDFRAGCPITSVLLDTTPDSAMIHAACKQAFDGWVCIWHESFEYAGLNSETAREMAMLWVASLEGAWILARANQSTSPFTSTARLFNAVLQASVAGQLTLNSA